MSIRVLLREHPGRAIALVTDSHALIFRHTPSTAESHNSSLLSLQSYQSRVSSEAQSVPRCIVEFSPLHSVDLHDYRSLSPRPVYGTLGLITITGDVFLCVVSGASKVASVRPGETVEKIFGVEFYCLNSAEHDNLSVDGIGPYGVDVARGDEHLYGQGLSRREPGYEHPCADLQKLLGNGSFYYSTDFDLTNRLQDRAAEAAAFDIENLDESLLWNSFMISPLIKFRSQLVGQEREALDASRILTSAIRGFVLTIAIPISSAPLKTASAGLPSYLTLISRLSCRRAGTRFNSRGIDDDGNVANFVESETIFWSPSGICFSYVQVRGSVPVFWEQAAGLIPGQQKISITRSKEGTQPAFDKHFEELEHSYGPIHVVNLLSETKPGEAELTELYRYGVRHSSLNQVTGNHVNGLLKETEFDFHAETKGPNGYEAASMVRRFIQSSAESFAYYLAEEVEDPPEASNDKEKHQRRSIVVLQQEGVFRTNCLDCLDRTNLVQTIISQMAVESFLGHREEHASPDFWMRHSSLWADNGDALSKIYAGTGALKSSFTRHGKMSLAGAIADARKSATRLYINNFADKGRQNTMDVLLGRLIGQVAVHLYDPINDHVTAEMNKRSADYTSTKVINIWVGTFNLNGRTNGIDEDLSEWLFPHKDYHHQPEMVVVGFQEIVELSPQQIMNSDPTHKHAWEKSVKKALNKRAREVGSEDYCLLRSGQLVGAALCIFVKASVLPSIKNVEGGVKKTGMSGMAGNKGAVAIRMDYSNTQICFVTAHLAAGFSNYDERNKDYHTINQGLRFQRNRTIDDHDTVIWLGDFNYRIGMANDRVRSLVKEGNLQTLYENDQLNIQMVAGLTFPHYSESRITFMPTYRFDIGEDNYDSSEKQRIPAWTDRILRKGTNIRQTDYYCAPLRFSDHRPVYATFQCTVSIIDEKLRDELSRSLFEKRKADVGGTVANSRNDDTDDEEFIGYDSVEPGLPPASSDQRKWWLENGLAARSSVQPPHKNAILNPLKPSNPWVPTDEPDWVTVPRAKATAIGAAKSANPSVLSFDGSVPANGTPRKITAALDADLPRAQSSGPSSTRVPVLPAQIQRSGSSASQNSISKKPPPVAKKPIHLAGSASVSPASQTAFGPNPPAPIPFRGMTGVQTEFPPPPTKATTGIGDRIDVAQPPPPPLARRTVKKAEPVEEQPPRLPRRSVDLLGELDGGSLKGWEALKPT